MEKSDDAAYTDAQRRSDVVLIHKFVGNGLFEVTAKITAYGRDVRSRTRQHSSANRAFKLASNALLSLEASPRDATSIAQPTNDCASSGRDPKQVHVGFGPFDPLQQHFKVGHVFMNSNTFFEAKRLLQMCFTRNGIVCDDAVNQAIKKDGYERLFLVLLRGQWR
ncbi:hypothetical protein DYB38_005184 [Aphanomyces astaci]|uniref:Uncharacterized protein n=1 Tax=Aphanomyces astaci TaxID=112090 RepID=A0A397CYY8_APHAT|nr:hypothetical protein DYB38_005184 [Aphanomyces astaci]